MKSYSKNGSQTAVALILVILVIICVAVFVKRDKPPKEKFVVIPDQIPRSILKDPKKRKDRGALYRPINELRNVNTQIKGAVSPVNPFSEEFYVKTDIKKPNFGRLLE